MFSWASTSESPCDQHPGRPGRPFGKKIMRIVLDSNEYILGLDTTEGPSASSRLLDLVRILIDESKEFRLLVPEIIVKEVQRIKESSCIARQS